MKTSYYNNEINSTMGEKKGGKEFEPYCQINNVGVSKRPQLFTIIKRRHNSSIWEEAEQNHDGVQHGKDDEDIPRHDFEALEVGQ